MTLAIGVVWELNPQKYGTVAIFSCRVSEVCFFALFGAEPCPQKIIAAKKL